MTDDNGDGQPGHRRDPLSWENGDEPAGLLRPGRKAPSRRSEQGGKGLSRFTRRRQMPIWQETMLLLGLALILAIVIKAFFVQAFYIPSESMEPGLVEDDRILVQKVSYWGEDGPERGDVVVFKDPGGWLNEDDSHGPENLFARGLAKVGLYPTGGHLVKRVIGVGGDRVTCNGDQCKVAVNGHELDEDSYVKGDAGCGAPMINCDLDVTVPKGYLLVMGDNRAQSEDSTAHLSACKDAANQCPPTRGFVPVEDVVGKVFVLVWPRDHWTRVKRPSTFDDIPKPQ